MSKIADDIYNILKESFPNYNIIKEYYIGYENYRLFFDFFIKEFGAFIEVQGRQHTCYVHHFHGCMDNFKAQKHRDNLKLKYIQSNKKLCLIRFYHDEVIDKHLVLNKLYKALEMGFYE